MSDNKFKVGERVLVIDDALSYESVIEELLYVGTQIPVAVVSGFERVHLGCLCKIGSIDDIIKSCEGFGEVIHRDENYLMIYKRLSYHFFRGDGQPLCSIKIREKITIRRAYATYADIAEAFRILEEHDDKES